MSLSIVNQPDTVHQSRNHHAYELQTDNYITTAGTKHETHLIWAAAPVADDAFTLAWTDAEGNAVSVTMTCKTTPDDSGTQFRDNSLALPLEDWVDLFVEDLLKNYYIARDFDVTNGSSAPVVYRAELEAKEVGSNYDITGTESLADLTISSITAGVDKVVRDNFNIVTQLWVERTHGSGVYTNVLERGRIPDTDNNAYFDYTRALEAELEYNRPAYNLIAILEDTSVKKRYYIKYGEKFGDPATPQGFTTGATKHAVKGGFRHPVGADLTSFFTDAGSTPFQTPLPHNDSSKKKIVSADQREYLWFLSWDVNTTTVKVAVDAYFTDGTSNLGNIVYTKASISQYDMLYMPAGYNQLSVGTIDAGKTVDYYVVKMLDQADAVISELRYYKVDFDYQEFERHFVYSNSRGGFDTLRCTGERTHGHAFTFNQFMRILDYDYSEEDFQIAQEDIMSQEMNEQATGYVTRDYLDAMVDFLMAWQKYEVIDSHLVPIVVDLKKVKFYKDKDTLNGFKFTYRQAFMNPGWDTETL